MGESVAALRRALKEERDLRLAAERSVQEKDLAHRELLKEADQLKDEKLRLGACLKQLRASLEQEREAKAVTLTGGSMLNTLLSSADGTLPELQRLKQERELFSEELERRNNDLLTERREKNKIQETQSAELNALRRQAEDSGKEVQSLTEILEAKEEELEYAVNEKQELVTQLKTNELDVRELRGKLQEATSELKHTKNSLTQALHEAQERFRNRIPFDDTVDKRLSSYVLVTKGVKRMRSKDKLFRAVLKLTEQLVGNGISWRTKGGSSVAQDLLKSICKLFDSIQGVYEATKNYGVSVNGCGRVMSTERAASKLRNALTTLTEAHRNFATQMSNDYPSNIQETLEMMIKDITNPDFELNNNVVGRLTELAECLRSCCASENTPDELKPFYELGGFGDTVYSMAKVVHDYLSGERETDAATDYIRAETKAYIRNIRERKSEELVPTVVESKSELAEAVTTNKRLSEQLEQVQAEYSDTASKLTAAEKLINRLTTERNVTEVGQRKEEQRQKDPRVSTLTPVNAGNAHLLDDYKISAERVWEDRHVRREAVIEIEDLKKELQRADALAVELSDKYTAVVDLVAKLKEDRQRHYTILSQCKAEAERVRSASKNELETTKSSYDAQLKVLTDHIVNLKETLDKKEREAEDSDSKDRMPSLNPFA